MVFGAELVALATQRSLAERRGQSSWLLAGADPLLERAIPGGQRRLAANPGSP